MASTGGRKLNIVVEGCCHGELPRIYASVLTMEQVGKYQVILDATTAVIPTTVQLYLPFRVEHHSCKPAVIIPQTRDGLLLNVLQQ